MNRKRVESTRCIDYNIYVKDFIVSLCIIHLCIIDLERAYFHSWGNYLQCISLKYCVLRGIVKMPQSVCRETVSIALRLLSSPEFMNCGFCLSTFIYGC